MVADKQLAKELDYDMRQFNMRAKRRMSLQALSPAVIRQGGLSPCFPSPSPRRQTLKASEESFSLLSLCSLLSN